MDTPDLFKNKTPKIFHTAKTAKTHEKKMREWLLLFDFQCEQMCEYGAVFLEQFKKTESQCVFNFSKYVNISNDLSWGRYNTETNEIHFGEAAFCNKKDFFKVIFHEGVHAIQNHSCPSGHSYIVHPNVPLLVLSPSHRIRQILCVEKDAHAKDSLFIHLYDWINSEDREDIKPWIKNRNNLKRYIRDMADEVLTYVNPDHREGSLYEYTVDSILTHIESDLEWCKELKKENVQYASLGKDDLWGLGNSLNINSLYDSRDDIVLNFELDLNYEQKERLGEINAALNILDENTLPGFSETLKKYGVTPQEHIGAAFEKYSESQNLLL